jgi:hypothetical protein
VKLAAFYGGETLHENSPMVSNLINVGQVKDVSVDFSITIDVRNYSPTTAHRIYVFMWEDDNGDNLFDDGESNSEAEGISGCDVFGSGVPAAYYWDGLYWTSWANGNPEVDSDTYTGARLENKYDL